MRLVWVVLLVGAVAALSPAEPGGGAGPLWLRQGERPVLTWCSDAAKPYIHPLLTPAGYPVTANSPPGLAHHHGLWFAWGRVRLAGGETVDFWQDQGDPERTGRVIVAEGPVARAGSIAARLRWQRASDGRQLLDETREVRVLESPWGRANLVGIVSTQTATTGLTLSHESNEATSYFGMALQVSADMNNGLVVNSNGHVGRAAVLGDRAKWCAYATSVTPARGVAIFDHPSNPGYPAPWFVLNGPWGFLCPSPVATQDIRLEAGQRLRLVYGVLAFDGEIDAEQIGRCYAAWRRGR